MTPSPVVVGDLFAAALATPPDARTRFLAERCHDPATRLEVAELLGFDARAEAAEFLPPAAAPTAGRPVRTVGPYLLREEVGRGGMGSVYRAERAGDFRREVAVKLGPPGAADASLLERFRGERQVLAALDHPNIARLFDGGATPDGRPYFVMELVRGGRIDRHADDRGLPTRDRVRLFTDACRGVAYAHARGVVHRDLKPGNVLVSDAGAVKVVDFGLATRGDLAGADPTLTHTGQVIGTPGFLAPEQARGLGKDVTPAADVFALGATLYALLTGRPPFRADTTWESVRLTLDADPVSPSRLAPGLPRDLEAICLKCLEKDPARRYPTAAELVADLERFERDEPTQARPVGRVQRAWRWAVRRPLPAGLLATLAAVLIGSVASITALWLHAERSAEQARRHAAAADERNRTLREALKSYTSAANRLFSSPEQASPEEREALARGLELYERVLAEGGEDLEEQADVAYNALRLARGMSAIGEDAAAERACRRAIATLQRLADAQPERALFAHHLAEGTIQLAELLWSSGRWEEATAHGREAVAVAEALAARRPDSAECVGMCASLQVGLGGQLTQRGDPAEGERLLRVGVEGCREALRLQPEHQPRYEFYAHAVQSYAWAVFARTGSPDEYTATARPLFDLLDATVRDRPDDWPKLLANPLAVARGVTAVVWRLGRHEDARRHLARVAELSGQASHRHPADASAARGHAFALFELGLITAEDAEAAGRFRAALHAVEPSAARPSTPASLADRARLLATCPHPAVRDPARAVKLAREAVAADPGLALAWQVLPVCLCESGDFPGAVEALNRRQPGQGDRWVETAWGQLYKCVWQAEVKDETAAKEGLRAAEAAFADGGGADIGMLSLRDRAWRKATGAGPPPLPLPSTPEGK